MATYTDSKSNVTFNKTKNVGLKDSGGPILINGLTGTDPDDGTGIVNAIDIDWNGAVLFLKSFCKCSMMLQRLAKN